jgi:hypothetical protein
MGDLHEGYARFSKAGKVGFIDRNGKVLVSCKRQHT